MFCTKCGNPMPEGTKFCRNCGAPLAAAQPNPTPGQPVYPPAYAGNGEMRRGIPAPGFSDRVHHPEILAAVKKNRRAAGIFSIILVPIPLIGFVIYSMVTGEMEPDQALLYGGIVSGIFLLFALYGFIKGRGKNTYEAVVIKKRSRETYRHKNSDDEMVTEYITTVQTTDGKKKKIIERQGGQIWAWDYLDIGDKFKYHPQFHFPYELYDKAKAPYLVCVSCGTTNPVDSDRCSRCNLPLLK